MEVCYEKYDTFSAVLNKRKLVLRLCLSGHRMSDIKNGK